MDRIIDLADLVEEQRAAGRDFDDALDDLLNRRSGLLGICGVNDMREIHRRVEQGDENAELAVGVTCHRLKKYIGAYTAALGRAIARLLADPDLRARMGTAAARRVREHYRPDRYLDNLLRILQEAA